LGIHIEDCNLEKGTINVVHTVQPIKGSIVITEPKTKSSGRLVTVPETPLLVLRKHINQLNKNQGLIFTTSAGGPISPSNLVKQ